MRSLLGIHNDGGNGKYLGLPEQFGRKKGEMFKCIIDKVKAATQVWNKKFLSHGGKEILLKAIALAMPICTMNVFRLPKQICDEINAILAKFWWSSGEKKGMHWCVRKKEGGLGFRDLEKFNQALLGKQVWRILQEPQSLVARMLRARYFSDGNIFTAVVRRKASYAWKSLLHGRDLLKQGMRFIIGKGETINMWTDPWLPTHPPRAPKSIDGSSLLESVSNYINMDGSGWDIQKIRATVILEDVEYILTIKLSPKAELDLLGWHYTDSGIYTVKSGYWLNTHLPHSNPITPPWGDPLIKQKIWKCSSPPKVKHFLWKTVSRSLAVGSNLRRRHITSYDQCMRCCSAPETEKHLLFDCPYAQRIWRASGILHSTIYDLSKTLEEKIDVCLTCNTSSMSRHIKDFPIGILWRIWKSRNTMVFQQKNIEWWVVLKQARFDAAEWTTYGTLHVDTQVSQQQPNTNIWKRPKEGYYKCNYDGSFANATTLAKAGWVLRDSRGTFLEAGHAIGHIVTLALEAELQAFLIAMQHCWIRGFTKVIMEGDNSKVVDIPNSKVLQFGTYNWKREIQWWLNKFEDVEITWIRRQGNMVADSLSKEQIPNGNLFYCYNYIPPFATNLIHYDYLISSV